MTNDPERWLAAKPADDVAVPESVRRLADGAAIEPVWQNQLGGLTYAIGDGPDRRFAKWARHDSGLDLAAEAERLRWAREFTAVPEVLDFEVLAEESILVTAAMPGQSAVADRWKAEPAAAVRAIGAQLRIAHDALPVETCPYDWSVTTRLATKTVAVDHRSRDRWPEEFRAIPTEQVDELLAHPPEADRLVVCHGDACAPNTLIGDDGAPIGIVDLGTLGVADRWADLAVATWSTEWNYGPGWEAELLDAYGIDPDPERSAFYRLLWELT